MRHTRDHQLHDTWYYLSYYVEGWAGGGLLSGGQAPPVFSLLWFILTHFSNGNKYRYDNDNTNTISKYSWHECKYCSAMLASLCFY